MCAALEKARRFDPARLFYCRSASPHEVRLRKLRARRNRPAPAGLARMGGGLTGGSPSGGSCEGSSSGVGGGSGSMFGGGGVSGSISGGVGTCNRSLRIERVLGNFMVYLRDVRSGSR